MAACKNTKEQEGGKGRNGGKWKPGQSGNPHGRPQGATCNALRMAREAAERVAIPKLIEAAEDGNLDACKTLVAYGLPRQKPIQLPEAMPLPVTEDFTEGIRNVLLLVAQGEISVDVGLQVASIYALGMKAEDAAQIQEELDHVNALLELRPAPPKPRKPLGFKKKSAPLMRTILHED